MCDLQKQINDLADKIEELEKENEHLKDLIELRVDSAIERFEEKLEEKR